MVEDHKAKRVRVIPRDPDLNKMLGNELELSLEYSANIIDVIRNVRVFILLVGIESLCFLLGQHDYSYSCEFFAK